LRNEKHMSETSPTISYLHITTHLVNGKRQHFLQKNAHEAQHILDQVRLDRLFAQKHFTFASDDSITIIATESVERLDVRADFLPTPPHSAPIVSVEEVAEDEFQHAHRSLDENERPKVVMLVELRSGAVMYLRVRFAPFDGERPEFTPDDSRLFLTHLFTRPVLFGTTEDGQGLFLLQPGAIDRFTIAPAPPVSTPGSWAMNRHTT